MDPATEEEIRATFGGFCNPLNEKYWKLYKDFLVAARTHNYGVLFNGRTPYDFQYATPDCPTRDGYARVDDLLSAWVENAEIEEKMRPLCNAWEELKP